MSLRRYTYYKLDGFEVWGKEYRNAAGVVTWDLRVFSDQDRRIETYESVRQDDIPATGRIGEAQAMREAIDAWSRQG